jgi:hypothetical protein
MDTCPFGTFRAIPSASDAKNSLWLYPHTSAAPSYRINGRLSVCIPEDANCFLPQLREHQQFDRERTIDGRSCLLSHAERCLIGRGDCYCPSENSRRWSMASEDGRKSAPICREDERRSLIASDLMNEERRQIDIDGKGKFIEVACADSTDCHRQWHGGNTTIPPAAAAEDRENVTSLKDELKFGSTNLQFVRENHDECRRENERVTGCIPDFSQRRESKNKWKPAEVGSWTCRNSMASSGSHIVGKTTSLGNDTKRQRPSLFFYDWNQVNHHNENNHLANQGDLLETCNGKCWRSPWLKAATPESNVKQQEVRRHNGLYYSDDGKLKVNVKALSSPETSLKDAAAAFPLSPNKTTVVGHRKLPLIDSVTHKKVAASTSPMTDGVHKTPTTDGHLKSNKSDRSSPFCEPQQEPFTRRSAAQECRPLKHINVSTLCADKRTLWQPENAIREETHVANCEIDDVDTCRRQRCATPQKETMLQRQRSISATPNGSSPRSTKQMWSKNTSKSKISSVQRGLPRRRQALDDQWWIRGQQTDGGTCSRCSADGNCDRNDTQKASQDQDASPRGIYWKSSANTSLHQDSFLRQPFMGSPTSCHPTCDNRCAGSDKAKATARKLPSVGCDRVDTWWRHSGEANNSPQCQLHQTDNLLHETKPVNSVSQLYFVRGLQQQHLQSDDVTDDSCRQKASKVSLSVPPASVSASRTMKTISVRTTSNRTPVG